MHNDFANFSTFFSSQVCNIPPIHVAAPSPQRIADALLTSRLCLSLPHIATPANGASEMRYSLETPFVRSAAEDAWGYRRPTHPALRRSATSPPSPPRPRERSRFQLTPDSVGGTRIDADAPQSAAADTLQHCIYSGTALRCISPSPLYPRTHCPGLTENGSALRTAPPPPLSRSSASPKRIGMDIRHTPTHSPLTLRVSGVTENSAFPTRLHLSPTLSLRADSLTLTSP